MFETKQNIVLNLKDKLEINADVFYYLCK